MNRTREVQGKNTDIKVRKDYDKLAAAASLYGDERDYWLNKLSGELEISYFPVDYQKNLNGRRMETKEIKISREVFSRLMKIVKGSNIRLHMVLVSGILLLLNKYTGSRDILVGVPIYRQNTEGEFINTVLVLRNRLNGNMTFKELIMQTRQTISEAAENANYPIERLLYYFNMSASGNSFPLFDVVILLENIHEKSYIQHINNNVIFSFKRTDKSLEGVIEYNALKYEAVSIERINNHFAYLLEEAIFNVDAQMAALKMISKEEKRQILEDFNNNEADFCKDTTIYQRIENHAVTRPNNTAIVYNGNHLTYMKLNRRANRLARMLRFNGIREDEPVGILLDRSPLMVESILAVWKSGGAYIPIDTQFPPRRTVEIVRDSGMGILLTGSKFVSFEQEALNSCRIIESDDPTNEAFIESYSNLDLDLSMNHLAYVIYTSGSTGKPKGAMVEHKGMANHIQAKINELHLTDESIVAQNASHTFDISVWQIFASLTTRGRIVIYPNQVILTPRQFVFQLLKDQVTILELVPSYLLVILDTIDELRGDAHTVPLQLDYLLVTGEEIKPDLAKHWFELYHHIKMVNAYGPTEASDDITHYFMDRVVEMERIPIGRPLQNLKIYIVDRNMNLCPVGVKGEIWVSGVGVGRGYMNDVEKTAKAFTEDTFIGKKGVRLYKTGDLGSWLADGNIDLFGRKDHQVKIRGFRIELGEIESKLAAHPEVKEAVVIAKENDQGNKHLCAYLVTRGNIDVQEIKKYLVESLPDYMVPAFFGILKEIPLTPSGKVDRKAMMELAAASPSEMN
jgi:amino acid adenylation domain-containing protein